MPGNLVKKPKDEEVIGSLEGTYCCCLVKLTVLNYFLCIYVSTCRHRYAQPSSVNFLSSVNYSVGRDFWLLKGSKISNG